MERKLVFTLRIVLLAWFCLAFSLPVAGSSEEEVFPEAEDVARLLNGEKPLGVLFHIYEQSEDALEWVLPRVVRYTERFRTKWGDVPIAVVTHGAEMLGLARGRSSTNADALKLAEQLVRRQGVLIHVCGTYASSMGLGTADFPDFIDVVPFGPTQVADYVEVGYEKIDLELTW